MAWLRRGEHAMGTLWQAPPRVDNHAVNVPRRLLDMVWLLALLTAACTGFRAVGNDVYRCPQPGEDQLARTIEANDIRTVVSLRGDGQGTASSARAAEGAGISCRNVPMSATRLPRPETLLELWQIAATAERPLLLHCRAGVDRTGLACAICVLHDTGDLAAARDQLAMVSNGHLGMFGTEKMDAVLDRFAPYAGELAFPDWVRNVYGAQFAAALH